MKYFLLTIRHKWFVFLAGLKFGCPIWQLIIHDWSKFTPSELPHYQRQFFGDKSDPEGFARAWLHHQNHNLHHWEYWIQRTTHDKNPNNQKILDIPNKYIVEMLSDWFGASRAYEGHWPDKKNWTWLMGNYHKIILSEDTRVKLEYLMRKHKIFIPWLRAKIIARDALKGFE